MSKKGNHLEGLGNIFGTLKTDGPPPSPAPVEDVAPITEPPAAPAAKAGRGRPATGKKSNLEYFQTSVSVRKETHKRVKMALLSDGNGVDFGDLVEELLSGWLNSRT